MTFENTAITTNNNVFGATTGMVCTIDTTSDEGKITIARAFNNSDSLKDYMNTPLELAGVIMTPGKRAVSGNDCVNSYLVLDDGKILFSQSDGVKRSLEFIMMLWGDDFKAGKTLAVTCEDKTLNNGNTIKNIVPIAK